MFVVPFLGSGVFETCAVVNFGVRSFSEGTSGERKCPSFVHVMVGKELSGVLQRRKGNIFAR